MRNQKEKQLVGETNEGVARQRTIMLSISVSTSREKGFTGESKIIPKKNGPDEVLLRQLLGSGDAVQARQKT